MRTECPKCGSRWHIQQGGKVPVFYVDDKGVLQAKDLPKNVTWDAEKKKFYRVCIDCKESGHVERDVERSG